MSTLFQVNEALKEQVEYIIILFNNVVKLLRELIGLTENKSDEVVVNNPLIVCLSLLTTLIPGSSVGRVSTNALSLGQSHNLKKNFEENSANKERDYLSGKLTEYGKTLLVNGRVKCKLTDIDIYQPYYFYKDPLDLPICSYEIRFVSLVLIKISKFLNKKYNLPKNNQFVMCSWEKIIRNDGKPFKISYESISGAIQFFWAIFRFDFRFLSSVRYFSFVIMMISYALYRLSFGYYLYKGSV